MDWIYNFNCFLFDLDGLLVDTERMHFQAYINACTNFGFKLTWSFQDFCAIAHTSSKELKSLLSINFSLSETQWNDLYSEKKLEYLKLLKINGVKLMPGVDKLLNLLNKNPKNKKIVVTHSSKDSTDLIRNLNPLLATIPHWITRENYINPKPHPESYLKAIQLHSFNNDKIIGFEDSLRGVTALSKSPAIAVLICSKTHPQMSSNLPSGVIHYESFNDALNQSQL